MEKRGVSDVITTVLIVLLVLAAVAIIGGIILKNLGEASEKIEAGFNTVSLSVQGVKVNKDLGLVSFNLVRNAGQGNVKGYNVVIEDSNGQRYVQKFSQTIAELETKPVDVWYPKATLNDVSKVSVSHIIGTSTGKEYPSEISSSYKASGSEPIAALDYLVGYWNFDEGSGTRALDSSASAFHGDLFNNPLYLSLSECKVKTCLQFDGRSYVKLPDLRSRTNLVGGVQGKLTVMAWIKPTNLDEWRFFMNGFPGFLYFGIAPSDNLMLMTKCNPACRTDGNTNYWPSSTKTIQLNQWTHVAFVLEGGIGYRIYINGTLDREVSESRLRIENMGGQITGMGQAWDSSGTFGSEGGIENIDRYFRGNIDEVIVFNRSLTTEEIKSYYESTK